MDVDSADVNGDGRLDIVTANFDANGGQTNSLSTFLSLQDGGFGDRVDSPLGDTMWGLKLGDLNGDGKPDAVVRSSNNIRVLVGDGSGMFALIGQYDLYNANTVVITDANRDGKADLLISAGDFYYGYVHVFAGRGDGSFVPPVTFQTDDGVGRMAAADLNDDGIGDFVLGSAMGVGSFLGNGDGTFRQVWSSRGTNGSVAIGNFDGDGRQDVVVMQRDFHWVQLLKGNGDGTFVLRERFNVGEVINDAAVADLDGDGIDDVVTSDFASNEFSVLLARISWGFAPAKSYAAAPQSDGVVIGDFSGDGIPDVVTVGTRDKIQYGRESMALLTVGRGDGTFIAPINYPLFRDAFPNGVAAGDINDDGKEDLVTANSETWGLSVLLRTGAFTFELPEEYLPQFYANAVVLADLNGDQKLDVAVAGGTDLYILLNDGHGRLLVPPQPIEVSTEGGFANGIVVSDLDGDGDPDLVVSNRDHQKFISIMNNGDGSFEQPTLYEEYAIPKGIAVADLNHDSRPDIIIAADNLYSFLGGVTVHLNAGNGTFPTKSEYIIGTSLHPTAITAADLDRDGNDDIVVTTMHDATEYVELRRFMGVGDGTLQARLPFYSVYSINPWSVLGADLDLDGVPDIATANYGSEDVSIFKTLPGGELTITQHVSAGEQARFITKGQMNSDHSPDLIVTNYNGSSLTLIQNACESVDEPHPTDVKVSGRVLGSDGKGVRAAAVTLTSSDGVRVTVSTSSLGYFVFEGVPTGGAYTLGVNSKRFRFASRTMRIDYDLSMGEIVGVE